MTCKTHPKYKAVRAPVPTKKHPGGCSACWAQYAESLKEKLKEAEGWSDFHSECASSLDIQLTAANKEIEETKNWQELVENLERTVKIWKNLAQAPIELLDEDHQTTLERAEKAEKRLAEVTLDYNNTCDVGRRLDSRVVELLDEVKGLEEARIFLRNELAAHRKAHQETSAELEALETRYETERQARKCAIEEVENLKNQLMSLRIVLRECSHYRARLPSDCAKRVYDCLDEDFEHAGVIDKLTAERDIANIRLEKANALLRDCNDALAYEYGPLDVCVERVDNYLKESSVKPDSALVVAMLDVIGPIAPGDLQSWIDNMAAGGKVLEAITNLPKDWLEVWSVCRLTNVEDLAKAELERRRIRQEQDKNNVT